MTRRTLISLPLTVLAKEGPSENVANEFASTYNIWAKLLRIAQPGVVDAKEELAWYSVVKAWGILKRAVKY